MKSVILRRRWFDTTDKPLALADKPSKVIAREGYCSGAEEVLACDVANFTSVGDGWLKMPINIKGDDT